VAISVEAAPNMKRLNKDAVVDALEIVAEQILASNTMAIDPSGVAASFANDETLSAARTLYTCVMHRRLCEHVMREVERRNMLPITIHSLSTLFCEAMTLYKMK
jgi:3-hydroxyacyl-CoA dehydrogenase